MFSFLTGKKDAEEKPEATERREAPAVVTPPVNPPVLTDEPPAKAWDTGPDTPFHAPEAWNVDALTAPKPPQSGEVPQIGPVDSAKTAEFQQKIIDVIKTVFDPEIPVD